LALKIHSYHKENKSFTLDNLLHFAKEEVEYTAGRTTLYKILKSMGYRYKKVNG
jgi:transposase